MGSNTNILPDSARLGLAARIHCLSIQPKIRNSNQSIETLDAPAESMADIGALHVTNRAWISQHTGPGRLNGLVMAPGQLFHVVAAQLFCAVPDSGNQHQQAQR